MPVSETERSIVTRYLWDGEHIDMVVRQAVLQKGITPTIIAVTNKRVIVISRKLVPARTDVDSIPFTDIMAVRFEEGVVYSSVFLRLTGTMQKEGFLGIGEERQGELGGLDKKDAKSLAEYVEKAITEKVETKKAKHGEGKEEYVYCSKCGTKNGVSEACSNCGATLVF